MVRAKSQLQIRIRLTILNLTPRGRLPRPPRNSITARIRRRNLHRPPRKPISKDIAHVIPNLIDIEVIREDGLADVRLENAAFDVGNLERDPPRHRVAAESLTVRRILGDCVLRADTTADGPEIDGFVALVGYYCAADCLRAGNERGESDGGEEHSECSNE